MRKREHAEQPMRFSSSVRNTNCSFLVLSKQSPGFQLVSTLALYSCNESCLPNRHARLYTIIFIVSRIPLFSYIFFQKDTSFFLPKAIRNTHCKFLMLSPQPLRSYISTDFDLILTEKKEIALLLYRQPLFTYTLIYLFFAYLFLLVLKCS